MEKVNSQNYQLMASNQHHLFDAMKSFLMSSLVLPFCERYIKTKKDYDSIQSSIGSMEDDAAELFNNTQRLLRQVELTHLIGQLLQMLEEEIVIEFITNCYNQYTSLSIFCTSTCEDMLLEAFHLKDDIAMEAAAAVLHQILTDREREQEKLSKLKSLQSMVKDFKHGFQSRKSVRPTQLQKLLTLKQEQQAFNMSKKLSNQARVMSLLQTKVEVKVSTNCARFHILQAQVQNISHLL